MGCASSKKQVNTGSLASGNASVKFTANFSEIEPSKPVKPGKIVKSNTARLNTGLGKAAKIRFAETEEDLETILAELFHAADADTNGYLDVNEIEKLLRMAGLELTTAECETLVAQCDLNGDGRIDFKEWMSIGVDLIEALRAQTSMQRNGMRSYSLASGAEALLGQNAETMHGMTPDELTVALSKAFKAADVDSDGKLSREELEECLKKLRLNDTALTSRELRATMRAADTDKSGFIEYDEFATAMTNHLAYVGCVGFRANELQDLSIYLRQLLGKETALTRRKLRSKLESADLLKLSHVQVHLVIMEVFKTLGFQADAETFLVEPLIMPLAKACVRYSDPQVQLRKEKIAARANVPPLVIMQSIELARLSDTVESLWKEHGSVDESMTRAAFDAMMGSERVARYLLSFGLVQQDISFALDHADKNGDGLIDHEEFFELMVGELCAIAREKTIATHEAIGKVSTPTAGAVAAAAWLLSGASLINFIQKVSDFKSLAAGVQYSSTKWLDALREASGLGDEVEELSFYLPGDRNLYDWGTVLCTCRAIRAAAA